jgi:hypothetical protein
MSSDIKMHVAARWVLVVKTRILTTSIAMMSSAFPSCVAHGLSHTVASLLDI